jgi:hypothetical protein
MVGSVRSGSASGVVRVSASIPSETIGIECTNGLGAGQTATA